MSSKHVAIFTALTVLGLSAALAQRPEAVCSWGKGAVMG
jgi:hypothetical protein